MRRFTWRAALFAIVLAAPVLPAASRAQGAGVEFVSAIDDALLLRAFAALASDSMQGRKMASPGSLKAREYIVAQLKRMEIEPLVPDYVAPFIGRVRETMPSGVNQPRGATSILGQQQSNALTTSSRSVTGSNILGIVRGSEHPERYIVVSAHYDHVGIEDGQLFPGANDNASGAAALFVIADLLAAAKPKNSVVFAFFDGEESGMQGSNAFLAKPPINTKQVVANVNLDMLARNDEQGLYVVGSKFYTAFSPIITGAAAIGAIPVRAGHEGLDQQEDFYRRSDQLSFHERGIPAVLLTTGNFEDLHRPTDTVFRANISSYIRAVSAAAEFVRRLDESYDLLFTKKR